MSFIKRFQKSFLSLLLLITALVGGTGLSTVLFQSEGSAAGANASSTGPIFSFMSMSDTHSSTGNTINAVKDAVANNISSMVLVGDITNQGDPGEYDSIFNAINSVNYHPQVYYTIGNHEYDWDDGANFTIMTNRFKQKIGIPESTLYYSRKVQGYDFIFLAYDRKLSNNAYMSDDELAWLDSTLAADAVSGKPIFLFNHQPIYQTVSRTFSAVGSQQNTVQEQKFKNILEKYPQAILTTGHLHDDIKLQGNLYAGKFSAVRDGAVVENQAMIFDVYQDKVHLKGRDVSTQQTIWEGTISLKPNTTGTYEAEDSVFTYATQSEDVNASGGKVVNMNDGRAYIESLKVDGGAVGGNKILKISYATDAANVNEGIYVNGSKVQAINFPTTGSMSSYSDLAVAIELKPGTNNKIVIQSDGSAAGVNMDKLQVMDSANYSTMWGFNGNGNDSIANGINAVLKGSAAYDTTDKMEGSASLSLNGVDGNYASAGLASSKTDDVTLTAWVKWNGANSGSQQILTNGDGLTNGYSIVLDHSQGDKVSIAIDGQTMLGSQTALTSGQWTNVTATRRSGTWELYLNGKNTPITNNMAAPSTPTTGTYIGADSSGKQSFNGRIDAVRVYNQALSTDQIMAIAKETSGAKLQSIAITTLPTKLNYLLGEKLMLEGLVVTGTYSDGTTKVENVTVDNITGYDNSTLKAEQQLTVAIGSKTTSFNVNTLNEVPGSAIVPGRILAANYNSKHGETLGNEPVDDGGPTWRINSIDPGNWLEYNLDVAKTGLYQVTYRAVTKGQSFTGEIELLVDGVPQKKTSFKTDHWNDYRNISDPVVALSAGPHKIRLNLNTGYWALRWFELTEIPQKELNSITEPAPLAAAIGTAKTAAALGLPGKVSLVTDIANVDAGVTWDLSSINYDPTIKTVQTFTVPGTVTLPIEVVNTNNVPLTTSIRVTVNKIPSSQMTATATSQETANANNAASMAIDGNPATFWHTKWSGSVLPQSITLNLGGTYNINKVVYLPRPGGGNGTITSYNVYVSTDGVSFINVANGNWANDATEKIATIASTNASYVKLEATAGVGGFASAAEIGVTVAPSVLPNLVSIKAPAAITGLDIGTARTAAALGLPANAVLVTESENVDANVTWDLSGINYDPATKAGQTFTVPGTVALPSGVANANNVPLTTSVSVTVNKIPSSQMTATADSACSASESAAKAIDGIVTGNSKWCSKSSNRWLQIDLGSMQSVNGFIIKHASEGGEPANWNTRGYNIQVSSDGTNWSTVVNVTNNTNGITIDRIAAISARYIKLNVPVPTQDTNQTARIYEFQVLVAPSLDKTLMGVTTPAAITGVVNGTAKTAAALGLPTVELVTDTGSMNTDVTWNVDGSSYDPAVRTQQVFTVSGTVTLPAGVVNPNNVALTTSVSVTVLPAPATPMSTLTGVQQVLSGQTFTLTMGLAGVTQSVYQQVYAQDFTLQYDPASVQFDSVTSLKDGFRIIDTKETAPGQLRIVAASVGVTVPAQGDLLAIQFMAKSVTQSTNTTISVDHVVIANGQGNELQLGGASREIQITVPSTPVDKSLLNAAIAIAQAKYDAAVEGNEDGLYVTGSKAQLQSAIDAAKAVVNDSNATQQQVDSAKAALEDAILVFESKKITTDINGGGTGSTTIGDLAMVAAAYGKQQGQAGWNEKADINHDGKVDIVDLAIVAKAILQ
ncbi:discoidin domain-containing protein [Paenibacillus planticolens]|uniref:Carbohydrate-binding protein n=1 Tax=Paenibacillus planticolens TaxID=2654976 RepID=A0ABX1ZFM9_9BACL|nr:discoidin domain-containing protein [Paenibacillus planticolens]NOU98898.1 carbohydrate-binding protein [Paenibacillus planticolens]